MFFSARMFFFFPGETGEVANFPKQKLYFFFRKGMTKSLPQRKKKIVWLTYISRAPLLPLCRDNMERWKRLHLLCELSGLSGVCLVMG